MVFSFSQTLNYVQKNMYFRQDVHKTLQLNLKLKLYEKGWNALYAAT